MDVKTIDLIRNIRDSIYNKTKDLSTEDQIKFYRDKASRLNNKLQQNKRKRISSVPE